MKRLLILISIALFVGACASGMKAIQDPFSKIDKKAKKMRDGGAVAVVGRGSSTDMNFALDQARENAEQKISKANVTKIEAMNKLFREDVGMAGNNEQSKHWVNVMKTVTVSAAKGAMELESYYVPEKIKNQQGKKVTNYNYALLLYIAPERYQKDIEDALAKEAADNRAKADAVAELERLKQVYKSSKFQEDLKEESAAFEKWLEKQ